MLTLKHLSREITSDENGEKKMEAGIVESDSVGELPIANMSGNSTREQMRPQPGDQTVHSSIENTAVPADNVAATSAGDHSTTPGNISENPGVKQSEEIYEDAVRNPSQLGCGGKRRRGRPRKSESTSGPPMSNARLLRSRSKEKSEASEANNASVNHDASEEKKITRTKRKYTKNIAVNEFSRIRSHLRYLFQRIKYEKTLIEAYSGEGWKGQSLEKIKLEKEIQRAKAQVIRYKLKIRDLFQHLYGLIAQGRLPESVYDSEGRIDSEDIFCAKCGSKDLPADNDIILCDGGCERGFHQFCLEPPLLKEDIPPGDEGWICPGCDCKIDCINLLNGLQGTNLSVADSWERVFPEEAVASASGQKLDDISGLPSDDSEDDDYNPDNPNIEKNDSKDLSSDESDFFSASDDPAAASPKDNQAAGISSEDSEDDDYDPDTPNKDEQVKMESSSSDFTSDAEDFSLIVDTNRSPVDEQGISPSLDYSSPKLGCQGGKAKVGRRKRHSLNDELSYLTKSDAIFVSDKRHVERLDYKELHDEAYGNASSDSSDEDYTEGSLPKKRKNKTSTVPPNQTPADLNDQIGVEKGTKHSSDSGTCKKLEVGCVDTSEPHSSGKKKSTYGEGVIKKLYEYFKENQYPDRDMKEHLGKELGLTARQVSKWFENTRFSTRHYSRPELTISASKESTSCPLINGIPFVTEPKSITNDASCNGVNKLELPIQHPNEEHCQAVDKRGQLTDTGG